MPRSVAYLDAAPAGAGACEPEPCVRQGSDGCDSVFEDGRVRSTLPGDMFLIGEVYGFNGRPDEGLKSSIAQITVAIRSYKISREWRWRDSCSGKWKDLFRRGVADRAIFDKLNEFSVAAEFDRPVLINGETHPGIQWEELDKFPGSRRRPLPATRAHDSGFAERSRKTPTQVESSAEDHIFDSCAYALRYDTRPRFSSRRL